MVHCIAQYRTVCYTVPNTNNGTKLKVAETGRDGGKLLWVAVTGRVGGKLLWVTVTGRVGGKLLWVAVTGISVTIMNCTS